MLSNNLDLKLERYYLFDTLFQKISNAEFHFCNIFFAEIMIIFLWIDFEGAFKILQELFAILQKNAVQLINLRQIPFDNRDFFKNQLTDFGLLI